ncbi:phosphatase PAP2 family protein [Candidatus Micrarchaeota archaeon]|nr:phosphatase PAP2 family protein [Candidatus Micrarchaeota archaeon]
MIDALLLWFSTLFHVQDYLVGVVLFAFGLVFLRRHYVFLYSVVVAAVLGFLVKAFFKLPRPCVDVPGLVDCPLDFGFPSLHAAFAAVLLMASLGSRWALLVIPLALLVGYSRIFLGVHSVEQVIAGFSLGIVVYLMAWLRFGRNSP